MHRCLVARADTQSMLCSQADERWALLQHGTKLYLVDACALSRDLAYQQLLRQFEALPRVQLQPPAELAPLLAMALDLEEAAGEAAGAAAVAEALRSLEHQLSRLMSLLMAEGMVLGQWHVGQVFAPAAAMSVARSTTAKEHHADLTQGELCLEQPGDASLRPCLHLCNTDVLRLQ
jgi:hypothetical protein